MKKQILSEEFRRMQKLAGIQLNEFEDLSVKNNYLDKDFYDPNDKALGILFHLNTNKEEREFTPYEWDENAIINLIKNIGYKDYEEVTKEFTHYFSPGDEDEMRIFRTQENNPELQPTDLTIGMYIKAIEQEFSKR